MTLHRQVFFMGGFDPKTPRHYHRIYRQACSSRPVSPTHEQVSVGPREAGPDHMEHWDVSWAAPEKAALLTRYHVMRWDDVVRRHWPRHLRQTLGDYWNVYVRAGSQGMLLRVFGAARPAFWLAMLPLGMAMAWAALAAGLAVLAVSWLGMPAVQTTAVAIAGWLLFWRLTEQRIDSEWLLRLYGFTWHQASGQLPDLEQRLDSLADAVVQAVRQDPAREILIVGHSTGVIMAVGVLARVLRRAPDLADPAEGTLSFLSLGHCTPILAWLRQADAFRTDLAFLAGHPALVWWDFAAAADWAAFAKVPPWLNAGAARLHRSSPRFHQTLGEDVYRALLANRHALHMQYLRAPVHAGGYDPVVLTAGPDSLADRYRSLASSRLDS
jgi:predicted alpha/beta hydrolase family esterase